MAESKLGLSIESNCKKHEKQITLRFIHEGSNNQILMMGDEGGQWKFIENFHQMEYMY